MRLAKPGKSTGFRVRCKPGFSLPLGTRKKPQRTTSAKLPLAITSAMRAKSWYMARSLFMVGHTDRMAACACCRGFEGFSGARKSIACAAAIA